MSSKRPVYKVPVPSTSFVSEAYFDGQGAFPRIRFGYRKNERDCVGEIIFTKALAVRTRAERCCTAWHIEGAYDTLVEVEDSMWIKEMKRDTAEQWRDKWEMHHYMIYLDSAGCFEIIAESWAAT
jgi:hypothetical protein